MAFLHSVIGDNTKENREHLEKIGINRPPYTEDLGNVILVYTDDTNIQRYETGDSIYDFVDTDLDKVINCINNPQLFKAVSAMRDDSDYMQFFVSKGWRDYYDDPIPDKWILCTSNTLEEFGNVNNSQNSYSIPSFGWRKATLAELQSHFKRV